MGVDCQVIGGSSPLTRAFHSPGPVSVVERPSFVAEQSLGWLVGGRYDNLRGLLRQLLNCAVLGSRTTKDLTWTFNVTY